MPIEFSLGDSDGFFKVVVRQSRVQDGVTGLLQEGWFATADDAGPAVEEEDFVHAYKGNKQLMSRKPGSRS